MTFARRRNAAELSGPLVGELESFGGLHRGPRHLAVSDHTIAEDAVGANKSDSHSCAANRLQHRM